MEHRKRNQNWTAEENEVFEKALAKYGRGDVTSIFAYLQDNIADFNRSERDVKKKIYNFLQENIGHEVSVKVRTQLAYAILALHAAEVQKNITESEEIVQRVSQLTKHTPKRVLKNFEELRRDPSSLKLSCDIIRKHVATTKEPLIRMFDSEVYLQLLHNYSRQLDWE